MTREPVRQLPPGANPNSGSGETLLVGITSHLHIVPEIVVANTDSVITGSFLRICIRPVSWQMAAKLGSDPNHLFNPPCQDLSANLCPRSHFDRNVHSGQKLVPNEPALIHRTFC